MSDTKKPAPEPKKTPICIAIRTDREGNAVTGKIKLSDDPRHGYMYADDLIDRDEAMAAAGPVVSRYMKSLKSGGSSLLELVDGTPTRGFYFESELEAAMHAPKNRADPHAAADEYQRTVDAIRATAQSRERASAAEG